mmetsp:Transcript_94697/g.268080  ORF Transcript_94697/g.268080 Transcript_94697/m.268080 type:complete len:241 (-) Transcript_94697:1693-2415(-)
MDLGDACQIVFVSPPMGKLGMSKGGDPGGSPIALEIECLMWPTWSEPHWASGDVFQPAPATSTSLATAARSAALTAASLPPACSSHQCRPPPVLRRILRTFRWRWPCISLTIFSTPNESKELPATNVQSRSRSTPPRLPASPPRPTAPQPAFSRDLTSSACVSWYSDAGTLPAPRVPSHPRSIASASPVSGSGATERSSARNSTAAQDLTSASSAGICCGDILPPPCESSRSLSWIASAR